MKVPALSPDLRPEWLIVRLENGPSCASAQALLDEEGESPDSDALVLVVILVETGRS